ncbi:unnamed protein product [Pedinophyceae sp. YPF-701]|nr:unnamed protein product [Pedinophyceae sp. YPF-701]
MKELLHVRQYVGISARNGRTSAPPARRSRVALAVLRDANGQAASVFGISQEDAQKRSPVEWDEEAEGFWRASGRRMTEVRRLFSTSTNRIWADGEALSQREQEWLSELPWMTESDLRAMVRKSPRLITHTARSLAAKMEALERYLPAVQCQKLVKRDPRPLTRSEASLKRQVAVLREALGAGDPPGGDAVLAKALRATSTLLQYPVAQITLRRDEVVQAAEMLLLEGRKGAEHAGAPAAATPPDIGRSAQACDPRVPAGQVNTFLPRRRRRSALPEDDAAAIEATATRLVQKAPSLLTQSAGAVKRRIDDLMRLMAPRVGRACVARIIVAEPGLLCSQHIWKGTAPKWLLLVEACDRVEAWSAWLDTSPASSIARIVCLKRENVAQLMALADLAAEFETAERRSREGDIIADAWRKDEGDAELRQVQEAAANLLRYVPTTLLQRRSVEGPGGLLEGLGVQAEVFREVVLERAALYVEDYDGLGGV